ncbi:hypothetical protein Bca4012_088403 [Brassica carinata]
MDQFTQTGSFQNLLNSQHPNTSFSFVTREASVDLSSSDASVFGSQWADDGKEDKVISKRRKLDDQSAHSSTSVPGYGGEEEAMARPVGVKAAKAKAKTKPTSSSEAVEFQGLWEIKQKDFENKDKLNKQKLLENLIAKTEPLSELELALKNKLISEMLLS